MFNKKIASEIAVGIIVFLAVIIGGIFWLQGKNAVTSNQSPVNNNQKQGEQQPEIQKPAVQKPAEDEVACTMDAKQCADGSYVGRIAPTCEFAACSKE